MKRFSFFLLLLIPFLASGQMTRTIGKYGTDGNLVIYTPPDTIKVERVILSLHGIGECGTTVEQMIGPNGVERNELPKLFKQGVVKPCIVIAPQLKPAKAPLKPSWGKNECFALLKVLDGYKAKGYDIHVTGISLGAMGAYDIVQWAFEHNGNKPGYFKSLGAVCGKTLSTDTVRFSKMFIKIWHGEKDDQVGVWPDRNLFALLSKVYNKKFDVPANYIQPIQYKEYSGWYHPIWVLAYDESIDGYWKWLESVDPIIPETDKVISVHIDKQNRVIYTTESGKVYFDFVYDSTKPITVEVDGQFILNDN